MKKNEKQVILFVKRICWGSSKLTRVLSVFLLLVFLNLIVGCHYYYKVGTGYDVPSERIQELNNMKKYFILHSQNEVWHIHYLKIKNDSITGTLYELTPTHTMYQRTRIDKANKYKKRKESEVLEEVHIYSPDALINSNNLVAIPIPSIEKIEIYEPDKGRTTSSWVFGTIGVVVGIPAVLLAIVALTKSSCPFVYTYNDETYNFCGEIYSGAIFSTMERDDYLPLPDFESENGQYQLKISNKLKERQFINLAELIVVSHDSNTQVLLDKYGVPHTYRTVQQAREAVSPYGVNYLPTLQERDQNYFYFKDSSSAQPEIEHQSNRSSIILSFENVDRSDTCKLLVNARNSLWLDYIYGEFTQLFGNKYNKWAEKQNSVPFEKHKQWTLEQGVPISVYLETDGGWEFVDYFNPVGPLASRDMIMPIDISKSTSPNVRIKLESGFMFWELDYAAADFSSNEPVEVYHVPASYATDREGIDVKGLLAEDDEFYYRQLNVGNEVILNYAAPVLIQGKRNTVALHTRGYYEYIRSFENKPNRKRLRAFKEPGSLSKFSKDRFYETCEEYGITIDGIEN